MKSRQHTKIAKDTTVVPFGTIEVKGVIKTPNHYKCINVVVDNLPENLNTVRI